MLAQRVVDEIRNLLATGLSYRKIAHATGVSRGTIGAIANGRRMDRASREEEILRRPSGPLTAIAPPVAAWSACLACCVAPGR